MSNGYDSDTGPAWVMFAGIMILVVGILNTIGGIAAIDSAHVYAGDAAYVFGSLSMWGWVILIIGIAQLFAAFSIWSGGAYGAWVGVISATANSIAQLFFLPAFPLWSLAIFGVDLLVIYGLVAYGGQGDSA